MNLKTLSVREASQATGIPAPAIRKLLDAGAIAGNRLGKNWRVSEASLNAWVNRTTTPPSTATAKSFPEVDDRFV